MSEHQQTQNTSQLNANLIAFIFIFTFTITGILIVSTMRPQSPQRQEGVSAEVALAESSTSAVPSDTPVPPTNTAMPTSTSAPLPTNTTMPTSAAALVTSAANTTPQTVVHAGQASGGNTAASYDPALAAQGEQLFMACSACHGADALGLPNLGKNLVESEFVHSLSDADLLTFVKTGRPIWDALNTTGIDMPPKGGNPAFTDDDILAIIAYLRSISAASGQAVPSSDRGAAATAVSVQPTPLPTSEAIATATSVQPTPVPDSGAEATAAIGAPVIAYDPALVSRGEELFLTCSACHGADALGLPKLGKNLVESEFIHSLSDADLLTFVKTGRPIWDALNTTGIDMPPKGGNPAFTDEDILAIIAYLRSLSAGGS